MERQMIIEEGEDLFGQQGQACAGCGEVVFAFPFISWDFVDNDSIARVSFHTECAKKFVLRITRDLHEIDAGR